MMRDDRNENGNVTSLTLLNYKTRVFIVNIALSNEDGDDAISGHKSVTKLIKVTLFMSRTQDTGPTTF